MAKTLFIPGKNYSGAHDGYRKDMQELEIWARQPIQQLIAGSGITLNPASGLATDSKGNGPNAITISASGGGGGSEPGFFGVQAYPDLGGGGGGLFYAPLNGTNQTFGPSGTETNFPIFPDNGNYLNFGINAFSIGYWTFTGAGIALMLLPKFDACNYTSAGGHQIKVQYLIWASDISFSNYGIWTATTPNIPSFTSYQSVIADFSPVGGLPIGADLSLGASGGGGGDGLLTAAGANPYLVGISGLIETSSDMVF